MREHRFGAVQNSEQYTFLYNFFSDFSKKKRIYYWIWNKDIKSYKNDGMAKLKYKKLGYFNDF